MLVIIVEVLHEVVEDLKLHLSDLELLFQVCQEGDGCLLSATG